MKFTDMHASAFIAAIIGKFKVWWRGSALNLAVILLLFAVSLGIRANTFKTPMDVPDLAKHYDSHHNWLTAQCLIYIENWTIYGIKECHYTPIFTYPGTGSNGVRLSGASTTYDSQGRNYYVSFPPLGFWAPWAWFKLWNIRPDVWPIQVFSMLLHLLCLLFLYAILRRLVPHEQGFHWALMLGMTIATLCPNPLWYQGNVYGWNNVGQLLWLFTIWCWLTAVERTSQGLPAGWWRWGLVFLGLTLGMMTDYLGFTLAFMIFCFHLFKVRRGRVHLWVALGCAVSVLIALGITLTVYSSAVGWPALWKTFMERGSLRTAGGRRTLTEMHKFFEFSWHGFGFFALGVLALAITQIYALIKNKVTLGSLFTLRGQIILFGLVLPVLMVHTLLLSDAQAHEFTHVKDIVVWAVLGTLLLRKQLDRWAEAPSHQSIRYAKIALVLLAFPAVAWGAWEYQDQFVENGPGAQKAGELIRQQSDLDETVTIDWFLYAYPEMQWYAQRNFTGTKPEEYLPRRSMHRGKHFEFDADWGLIAIWKVWFDSTNTYRKEKIPYPNSRCQGHYLDKITLEPITDPEYPDWQPKVNNTQTLGGE